MQIFYDENNYDIYLQQHVSFFPGINYAAALLLHAVRNYNIYQFFVIYPVDGTCTNTFLF